MAIAGLTLTGCQMMEPQLSLEDRQGGWSYRHQVTWLDGSSEPVVHIPAVRRADGNLWARVRQGFALQSSTAANARVDGQRRRLLSNRSFLENTGKAGGRYLHFIVGELAKRNMPMELALLPAIESGYNPMARSHAQAVGLWQFIPSTGRQYALTQGRDYDERRDLTASTRAALDYLSYLHDYFDGDWLLALAAYNAGEGRVSNAIARNRARGLATDYWSLTLPRETQDYVPRLLALSQLVSRPSDYGVALEPIADQPYFDVIALSQEVDLSVVAAASGISKRELRLLNAASQDSARGKLLLPVAGALRLAALPGGLRGLAMVRSGQAETEVVASTEP